MPYGGKVSSERLIYMAGRIQTYSEAVDEMTQPGFVASDLRAAKRIVFLGFGFHAQNVRILGSAGVKRPTLQCYATTDGIAVPRLQRIRSEIAAAMHVEAPNGLFFNEVNGNCEDFWNEYGEVIVD